MDKGLGFFPGEVDSRDRLLSTAMESTRIERTSGSQFWFNPLRLDQGEEGACVGFGWTQRQNSSPKICKYTNDVGREVYYVARRDYDPWDGEDYEGTSVRAGAKAALARGWIKGYAFARTIEEIALWVLNKGPVVIGVDWYESDYEPNFRNGYYLTGDGEIVGGHCLIIDGIRWNVKNPYARLLNSWGRVYGFNGMCRISIPKLEERLSAPHSVACTAVEV